MSFDPAGPGTHPLPMKGPASKPTSGIGRRRGDTARRRKDKGVQVLVAVASFVATSAFVFAIVLPPLFGSRGGAPAVDHDLPPRRPARLSTRADPADGHGRASDAHSRQAILRGELHLMGVDAWGMAATHPDHRRSRTDLYRGVDASFCRIDWDAYKADPPSLPMFRMLLEKSGCDRGRGTVTVDLARIVRDARAHDAEEGDGGVRVMPPRGFVFHESRVGSTLAANSLAAMDPGRNRVYSESDPINMALKACEDGDGGERCTREARAQLFRDVVYLLGRTDRPGEENMFFKVSSVGSKKIGIMQEAFPEVPWIFIYRDPVQTIMSHLDPEKVGRNQKGFVKAVCTRSYRNPQEDLVALAKDAGYEAGELSPQQFCAAHLATLCESALRGLERSGGRGRAVEYDGLTDKLIGSIIPDHFGVAVGPEEEYRIRNVAKTYSKGVRGKYKEWKEDSAQKDRGASPEIREAAATFLADSYAKLEEYS